MRLFIPKGIFALPSLFLALFLTSCSGGNGSATSTADTTASTTTSTYGSDVQVLAKNVLLSNANAGTKGKLEPDLQVIAANVVLDTVNSNNALSSNSNNLQDAINNDLAPDLSKIIIGTWNTKCWDSSSSNSNNYGSGTVTITSTTSFSHTGNVCFFWHPASGTDGASGYTTSKITSLGNKAVLADTYHSTVGKWVRISYMLEVTNHRIIFSWPGSGTIEIWER